MFPVDLNGWENFPGDGFLQVCGIIRKKNSLTVVFRFYPVPAWVIHKRSGRGTSCESPAPEEVSSGHLSFLKLKG